MRLPRQERELIINSTKSSISQNSLMCLSKMLKEIASEIGSKDFFNMTPKTQAMEEKNQLDVIKTKNWAGGLRGKGHMYSYG